MVYYAGFEVGSYSIAAARAEASGAVDVQVCSMAQGQKQSRFLALDLSYS